MQLGQLLASAVNFAVNRLLAALRSAELNVMLVQASGESSPPSQPLHVGPTSATRRKTQRFLTSSRRRAAERLLIGPMSETCVMPT